MIGAHLDTDTFKCAKPVHVCGPSNHFAMAGIDPAQYKFTCAY